jgi:hypothetical protein
VVAGPVKTVDLGIGRFAKGVKGTGYEARIKEIKADDWQDGWQKLSLELELEPDMVKEIKFYDAAGNRLEVSSGGHLYDGRTTVYGFSIKGAFPQGGRIVAEVREQLKTFVIPFTLEDVDLPSPPKD